MVVEEKYLKGRNLPPDFVVGTEGVFGIIVMTCIVLPIVAFVPGHGVPLHYSVRQRYLVINRACL